MKKIAAVLLVVCITCAGVFALDMGAGGTFDFSYTHEFMKVNMPSYNYSLYIDTFFIGFKGFFDAHYAVANIGMNTSVGKAECREKIDGVPDNGKLDRSRTYLNLGILGKYPFKAANITLFPLVGFDFDFILAAKEDGKKHKIDSEARDVWNRYWLDLGFGADIPVALDGKLCVRPQGIFGIKLNRSKEEKDYKKEVKDAGGTYSDGMFKFNIGVGVLYKF